jgi:hypothetical protein
MFKDGRTNVDDDERSGWPSVVSDLAQSVDQNIRKNNASQYQNFFSVNFHKFHAPFSTRLSHS